MQIQIKDGGIEFIKNNRVIKRIPLINEQLNDLPAELKQFFEIKMNPKTRELFVEEVYQETEYSFLSRSRAQQICDIYNELFKFRNTNKEWEIKKMNEIWMKAMY